MTVERIKDESMDKGFAVAFCITCAVDNKGISKTILEGKTGIVKLLAGVHQMKTGHAVIIREGE